MPRRLAERHPTEVCAEDSDIVALVPARGEVVRQKRLNTLALSGGGGGG